MDYIIIFATILDFPILFFQNTTLAQILQSYDIISKRK